MLVDNPRAGEPGEPDRLDLVDGGLMRTANVRVAVEKGCDLVVCYNPFTRIRYDRAGRSLHDHGLPTIATQSIRTLIGARLDLAKELVFLDPNVKADVVFIEPAEDDYAFFNMGALNFWAQGARHPPRLRGGAPVDRRLARAPARALRQPRHRAAHAAAEAAHRRPPPRSTCASRAAPARRCASRRARATPRCVRLQVVLSPDLLALGLALFCALATFAVLRGDRALAVAFATIGRLVTTASVFLRRAAGGIARKLRGERDIGPTLVRLAFEDLGPTYLKLGQLIASSHGLFPEAYCKEFQKTLDRVKPFAYADVERTLAVELRARPDKLFAALEAQPLASASIAQVHAARLPDGREVVVKIQRPHIERRVAADIRILRFFAQLISLVPTVELANPVGIIDDFDHTIREELDFRREAANMDEFNRIMDELGHADVRAPRVVHELTTRRVITMERFYGVRVDDVEKVRARAEDTEAKLVYGLRCWFQSMILYGFFHGDVHAGNLMILDDGALGFLDFGIIGRFDKTTRRQIAEYIVAFATGDFRALARVMMSMGAMSQGIDLDAVAADLEEGLRAHPHHQLRRPQLRQRPARHPARLGQASHAPAARVRAGDQADALFRPLRQAARAQAQHLLGSPFGCGTFRGRPARAPA